MRKYLHDYDQMMEWENARIARAPISAANKKTILKFQDYNISIDLSKARTLRNSIELRLVAKRLKKDLRKLTRSNVEKLLLMLKKEGKAVSTIETNKVVLRAFFKWQHNGKVPACVSWYKCKGSLGTCKLPDELLVPEEVKRLIKFALNKRDKAMIAMLWDSGARVGEIGGLQIKNIVFDEFGCKLMLDGKTGMRRIRVVDCAPYLLEWINSHPDSEDREAPIWVNFEQNIGEQLTHRYILKMLKKVAKRAKIKKPVNPHHFRHSRATHMAQHLTEAQMKVYFGWTQSSKMAARYVHLSGRDVDAAILKLHGFVKEVKKVDVLKRMPCPRCKEQNEVNNQYCQKCWLPLTPQATNEVQEAEEKDQEGIIAMTKLRELVGNNPVKIRQAITMLQEPPVINR